MHTQTQLFLKACKYGHTETVQNCINNGVDPSLLNNQAIRFATRHGHTQITKLLLTDPRVDPAEYESEALWWAAEKGNTQVVALLLQDQRIDPTTLKNYAIRSASLQGYTQIIKLLLTHPRVNPTAQNNEAIRLAAKQGHGRIIELLIKDHRTSLRDIRLINIPIISYYLKTYLQRKWRSVIFVIRFAVSFHKWKDTYYAPNGKGYLRAKHAFQAKQR